MTDEQIIGRYRKLRQLSWDLDSAFIRLSNMQLYYAVGNVMNAHAQVESERLALHPKYIEAMNRQSKEV